ncbi:MAG: Ribonuclease Y [Phycisphaerae bacterium]|nr:Ribonuclease Y [Phycisphaerae bacterium]
MKQINEILQQVDRLPPLPGTVVRLMMAINNPTSTVEDIVEAIRYDQAVTSEVLKLCNSAFFGLSRKVTSLNDAMLCLGTVKVLQLVMSVHANMLLSRAQKGYGLEKGQLWRHSVAVAIAGSLFAQQLKLPNINLAFTAGLLHDIGKVILNNYVHDAFDEIIRQVSDDHRSFTDAEASVLGFSHEEIGAEITSRWKLPEVIVRCIRYHHNPQGLEPPDPLVDVVYLANCVVMMLGIGLGADGLNYRADAAVLERHQLHERDLELVGVQTLLELKNVEQLFTDV